MRRVTTNPSIEARLFRPVADVSEHTLRLSFCRSLAHLKCLAQRIDEFEQNQCTLFDSDKCQEILRRQERTEQQLSSVISTREKDVVTLQTHSLRPYFSHRSPLYQNLCQQTLLQTSFEQLVPYLTHNLDAVRSYASLLLEQQQRLSSIVLS